MFLKALGIIADIILSPDEAEEKQKLNVSEDDGMTDAKYEDGLGNEYERDLFGELRDWNGNTPD